MPSLLGVAICLVCLCSLTWAWFTATQNSGVQPIQSATATVTASLNDTALGELKVGEPYSLNGTGKLTLHMAGDAQYAYVVIKVGDTEYHTDYLTADGYTITVNESGAALTLCWGKQDSLPGTAVGDGGSIGTAQQEPPIRLMSSLRRLTTVSRPRMLRFPALTMPIPAIRPATAGIPAARTAAAPAMAPANRGVIPAPEVIRAQAAVPAVTLGPATRLTAPTEPPANKRMQV